MNRPVPWLLYLVALVATAPIWTHPTALAGSYDWRYFESAIEAARRNVVWFRQLPLYDPWMCGGEVQLANPQSVAGSPAFLFIVLFGTAVGVKLMLVAFVALGLDGTYRLARELGLAATGAGAAALCLGLSGWIAAHFSVGHVSFFGAALVPHLLYFYRRALGDRRWAFAAGATMACIVAQGGNSTAVLAALGLGAVATVDCVAERRARALGVAALCGVAALGLGAYRLLPALEFAVVHPRHTTDTDGAGLLSLLRAAVDGETKGKLPGLRYALHEYAWRLPWLAWPLAIAGLIAVVRGRLRLGGLVLALVLLGLGVAMGDAWPYGPWWVMRHLPVLRDLRVPSRYVFLAALGLSLLAGAGLDALRLRLSPRWIVLGSGLVLVLLALDGAKYMAGQLHHVFDLPAPRVDHAAFHQVEGHWSQMLPLVYQNRGVVGCDEEAPLTRAASLDLGPAPQVRLDDPTAGTISSIDWSPNGYRVDVALARPTTLVFDTSWNEHYRSDSGTVKRWGKKWPADRDGGRLAVELPAMHGVVEVRYAPLSFRIGALLTVLSWAACAAITRRRASSGRG